MDGDGSGIATARATALDQALLCSKKSPGLCTL